MSVAIFVVVVVVVVVVGQTRRMLLVLKMSRNRQQGSHCRVGSTYSALGFQPLILE